MLGPFRSLSRESEFNLDGLLRLQRFVQRDHQDCFVQEEGEWHAGCLNGYLAYLNERAAIESRIIGIQAEEKLGESDSGRVGILNRGVALERTGIVVNEEMHFVVQGALRKRRRSE